MFILYLLSIKTEYKLKQIGKGLKTLRINGGYTSYENFAIEHDMGRKQYWRIEEGHNITVKTLIKVLDIHKISLKDFFESIDL